MPVYFFTYHSYQSWLPDNRRGYVEKGAGIQPTNIMLANEYRTAAKHPPFVFDAFTQYHLILKAQAVCLGDSYRLHGAVTESTHLHMIVSWGDELLSYRKVRGRIKNLLSLDLSRRAGVTGRPWFSTGSSRKRVKDLIHLCYLLDKYLPDHSGAGWYEDRDWVNLPPKLTTH
ncbi:MAG: hypothetical protein SH868_15950 [Bythopirellula sp.]|nr:hypothetical protein [Bythopirellula sp.]